MNRLRIWRGQTITDAREKTTRTTTKNVVFCFMWNWYGSAKKKITKCNYHTNSIVKFVLAPNRNCYENVFWFKHILIRFFPIEWKSLPNVKSKSMMLRRIFFASKNIEMIINERIVVLWWLRKKGDLRAPKTLPVNNNIASRKQHVRDQMPKNGLHNNGHCDHVALWYSNVRWSGVAAAHRYSICPIGISFTRMPTTCRRIYFIEMCCALLLLSLLSAPFICYDYFERARVQANERNKKTKQQVRVECKCRTFDLLFFAVSRNIASASSIKYDKVDARNESSMEMQANAQKQRCWMIFCVCVWASVTNDMFNLSSLSKMNERQLQWCARARSHTLWVNLLFCSIYPLKWWFGWHNSTRTVMATGYMASNYRFIFFFLFLLLLFFLFTSVVRNSARVAFLLTFN